MTLHQVELEQKAIFGQREEIFHGFARHFGRFTGTDVEKPCRISMVSHDLAASEPFCYRRWMWRLFAYKCEMPWDRL